MCKIVNNYYYQYPRVLHEFVPNNSFNQLLDISSKNVTFLEILTQNCHILKCALLKYAQKNL